MSAPTTTADEAVIATALRLAAGGARRAARRCAAVVASSPHLQASARNVATLQGRITGARATVRAEQRHAADVAAVVLGLRFRLTVAGAPDRYFAGEPAGDVGGLLDVAGGLAADDRLSIRDLLTGRLVEAADFDGAGFLRVDEAGDCSHCGAAAVPPSTNCARCGRLP